MYVKYNHYTATENLSAYKRYLELGLKLKQTTVTSIASKFDITPAAVKTISNLSDEDFKLI